MKKVLLSILTCIGLTHAWAQPCREVVGYYPGWQWYDRGQLVRPQTIDYSKYSILQYAFLNVTSTGQLAITDPWGDKNLLLGQINWATAPAGYDTAFDLGNPAYHLPNTNLAYYAHQAGVKLLVSIGGWTMSNNFAAVAANPTNRTTFANQCAMVCGLYNLDGVDIDWEYPGYAPHGGTPADKANFTLLLQAVRSALDAQETVLGRDLMLTIAAGASAEHQSNYEWSNITPLLDIINVMTYDFYGTFDPLLSHNAPLYYPGTGNPEYTCDASVQRLINTYGVPANKITMGVPFYGRSQLSNSPPVLFGTGNGQADNLHFGIDEGTPLYYNILLQSGTFVQHWDANARVPYMTSTSNNSFVSFDNAQSAEEKAMYIAENNLRGCIIWEITGDYIETFPGSGQIAGTPMATAINQVFCNYDPNEEDPECLSDCNQNGICDEDEVPGCEYPQACNYNPAANVGDGTCIFAPVGYDCAGNCLMDANQNFICDAEEIFGCTYQDSVTYMPTATWDDGSCLFAAQEGTCSSDLNGDGVIGFSDLVQLLADYGGICN